MSFDPADILPHLDFEITVFGPEIAKTIADLPEALLAKLVVEASDDHRVVEGLAFDVLRAFVDLFSFERDEISGRFEPARNRAFLLHKVFDLLQASKHRRAFKL